MPGLNNNLVNFTESIIRKMTRLSIEHDAINLSQGFPDFEPPKKLTDALKDICSKGPHQYAITWGAKNFREALAEKQSRYMEIDINPETNIVVTCGSTEAMMVAMMTVCNKGDKVIIFSPFYENYAADAILSGAEPVYVPLIPPDFIFSEEVLINAFKQKPKALILCNPANPTGKVFTLKELELIAKLAIKYDTFVITDEVYEHIVYEPFKHNYIASLPNMFERTISCSSLSKTYSITGWRLGYIIASRQIVNEARKIHDFLTVGAAAPLQEAAVTALKFPDSYYENLLVKYTSMKELFLNGLLSIGLKYTTPQGAYYVLVDISRFGFAKDYDFCEWLIKNIGVAAVPGSSFFKENENRFIRFHFAKKMETLEDAISRLKKLKRYTK